MVSTLLGLVSHRTSVGIPTRLVDTEDLSVERFLSLSAEERADIQTYDAIPPSLDEKGFGGFRVHWKTPKYRA